MSTGNYRRLVGYSNDTAITQLRMSTVSGGDTAVGGLVGGTSGGAVVTSYSATGGTYNYASEGRLKSARVGGLTGQTDDETSFTDSYWDTQVAGLTGGRGKTTRELQAPTANTGIYANWSPDWWDFGTVRQYPALKYGGLDVARQRR